MAVEAGKQNARFEVFGTEQGEVPDDYGVIHEHEVSYGFLRAEVRAPSGLANVRDATIADRPLSVTRYSLKVRMNVVAEPGMLLRLQGGQKLVLRVEGIQPDVQSRTHKYLLCVNDGSTVK